MMFVVERKFSTIMRSRLTWFQDASTWSGRQDGLWQQPNADGEFSNGKVGIFTQTADNTERRITRRRKENLYQLLFLVRVSAFRFFGVHNGREDQSGNERTANNRQNLDFRTSIVPQNLFKFVQTLRSTPEHWTNKQNCLGSWPHQAKFSVWIAVWRIVESLTAARKTYSSVCFEPQNCCCAFHFHTWYFTFGTWDEGVHDLPIDIMNFLPFTFCVMSRLIWYVEESGFDHMAFSAPGWHLLNSVVTEPSFAGHGGKWCTYEMQMITFVWQEIGEETRIFQFLNSWNRLLADETIVVVHKNHQTNQKCVQLRTQCHGKSRLGMVTSLAFVPSPKLRVNAKRVTIISTSPVPIRIHTENLINVSTALHNHNNKCSVIIPANLYTMKNSSEGRHGSCFDHQSSKHSVNIPFGLKNQMCIADTFYLQVPTRRLSWFASWRFPLQVRIHCRATSSSTVLVCHRSVIWSRQHLRLILWAPQNDVVLPAVRIKVYRAWWIIPFSIMPFSGVTELAALENNNV